MMQDVSLVAAFSRLAVVAVLMVVVLLVLRRTTDKRRSVSKRDSSRAIQLIDRQPLGKTQSVAVLRVHDYTLVVGVTDQRVELLGLLDPPMDHFEPADHDDRVLDLSHIERDDDDGERFFERLRERSVR
jgi:flagellar biogenesis protein FliO